MLNREKLIKEIEQGMQTTGVRSKLQLSKQADVSYDAIRDFFRGKSNMLRADVLEKIRIFFSEKKQDGTKIHLVSDNNSPAHIDEEVYEAAKETLLELIQEGEIELTHEELLDEIARAYQIGLDIKEKSGEAKTITIAARWMGSMPKK
jgi:uncharacterized protein YpiB (UPF0302 family)